MALFWSIFRLEAMLYALTFSGAGAERVKGGLSDLRVHAETKSQASCEEEKVRDVCVCEHKSFWEGYQCSSCKDPTKWGYGCDLKCPSECPNGICDFAGNCPLEECPENCKRNSRIQRGRTAKDICTNHLGNCQACKDGFFGLRCQSQCSEYCEPSSAEGHCTRSGACYYCKLGRWGDSCERECPQACPLCLQKAGLVDGEMMPAGACAQPCESDSFGPTCDKPCPEHCDRTLVNSRKVKSSCFVDSGKCKKCVNGRWGPQCEHQCNTNCIGGNCAQEDGRCEKECVPGFWGSRCDKTCPEFAILEQGCNRETGLPKACQPTHFPLEDMENGAHCELCPATCAGKVCNNDGTCSKGCEEGVYGPRCDLPCADNCAGGCHSETGQCNACISGKTGKFCKEACHFTCSTCNQFRSAKRGSSAGTSKDDCISCKIEDAADLQMRVVDFTTDSESGSCECIKQASRKEELADCTCNEPADPYLQAFFQRELNYKKCSTKCKNEFNGVELREVYGEHIMKCISVEVYNGVVVAHFTNKQFLTTKGQHGCEADQYPVPMPEGQYECLQEAFVTYILGGKKTRDRTHT